ncbi:hypothetical protein GBAR_LOCUS15725, partial [Geodia barretti]
MNTIMMLFLAAFHVVHMETFWEFGRTDVIIETLFCSILVVCNLATGISCAVLAGEWGKTPTSCIDAELHDACDSKLLSTTNAMQAVLHYYCAKLVL